MLRIAEESDSKDLLEIYAYYVEKTAITFEYEVPSIKAFGERIQKTLRRYPYLVSEKDGRLAGYAYAGPFKDRRAYRSFEEIREALADNLMMKFRRSENSDGQ